MKGVRSPSASKMQGDKKRQGIGVQGRDVRLPFTKPRRNHQGEGECRFLPWLQFPLPPWWCLLCIRYGQIKLNRELVRTCALRRKPKSTFLTEHLLVSSRLHEIDFRLSEIKRTFCLLFELKVQAALVIFSQSANCLIIHTASEKISLSADSDQMAPPSGHPQAFREKGLT